MLKHKKYFLCVMFLILLFSITTYSVSYGKNLISSISQLNSPEYIIGTDGGGIMLELTEKAFPNAKLSHFNDKLNGYTALLNGKIDALIMNNYEAEYDTANEVPSLKILPGFLSADVKIIAGLSKISRIPNLDDRFNSFIARCQADGTIDEMLKRWIHEKNTVLPAINVPEKSKTHLNVGTTGLMIPFSFYVGDKLTGFDIEFARRFAASIGAELEIKAYNYPGLLMAVAAGEVDVALSNLYYISNRSGSMNFSDAIYSVKPVVIVRQESFAPTKITPKYSRISELDGKPIGIQTGIYEWVKYIEDTLPSSKIVYYNTYADIAAALKSRKIEAFLVDEPVYKLMAAEDKYLARIDEKIDDAYDIAYALPKTDKGKKLRDEMNEYIVKLRESGELAAMIAKWESSDENAKTLPDYKNFPTTNGVLTMVTEGEYPPFNYYRGKEIVGLEIDIAARFCEASGYGLNVTAMAWDAIVPAIVSGKYDFAGASLVPSDEHSEEVCFSEPYAQSRSVMACLRADKSYSEGISDKKLSDFEGKNVGLLIGSDSAKVIEDKIPGVKLVFFDSPSYILPALRSGKIDAFYCALPTAENIIQTEQGLEYIPEYVSTTKHTTMFPKTEKGRKLCEEYAEFLEALQKDGTLDKLTEKWIDGKDESKQVTEDYSNLPSPNGILTMAVTEGLMPFVFAKDNRIQGYDIDLAVLFCKSKGCGLKIEVMNHNGVLSSIQTGKCDFSYTVQWTEERANTVSFSPVPNAITGSVLVLLKSEPEAPQEISSSFWDDIASSFEKTFVREQRWRLFADGILNTMTITTLAIFFGIILGFTAFMFCRTGSKIANAITKFSVWLIKGTPNVVLLMILYYIIFGHVDISGILVSTIAFALTFGTSVYRMLTFGTGAVDRGQTEAAYALGFTDLQTFFTVVLPQAAIHFMPSLREEVTLLIKSTSIVGYIAVQDLTKMGDIVRSRTYEAFFPLIAVALIYFVLAGMLNTIVTFIQTRITPSKRKPENILRGIKSHD